MRIIRSIFLGVLLFTTSVSLFAQDYQCIKSDAEYYYTDSTIFHAIRIDSVVNNSPDLLFFNYPAMAQIDYDCFSQFGPSWIGRKVKVKPDGKNIFYSKNNQPVTIETKAGTGVGWTCFTFDNGDYVLAQVSAIEEMTFLTLVDTVKKITFQTYNAGGSPINHVVNELELHISKHYGMVRAINFKLFPDSYENLFYAENCKEFYLCGISNPEVGIQNLTAAHAFQYNIGDEVNTYRYYGSTTSYYSEESFIKRYVLDIETMPGQNNVEYNIHRCGYKETYIPYTGYEYYYFNDTTTVVIDYENDSLANYLPDEVVADPDLPYFYVVTSSFYDSTGKQAKTVFKDFWWTGPDSCISFIPVTKSKYAGDNTLTYIENLGRFSHYYHAYDHLEYSEPVYFLFNENEWGIPWDFNCEDLPVTIGESAIVADKVSVSPNPMHNYTKVTIAGKGNCYDLQLFDMKGQLVKEIKINSNESFILRESLKNGIYFLCISNNHQVIHTTKLMVN